MLFLSFQKRRWISNPYWVGAFFLFISFFFYFRKAGDRVALVLRLRVVYSRSIPYDNIFLLLFLCISYNHFTGHVLRKTLGSGVPKFRYSIFVALYTSRLDLDSQRAAAGASSTERHPSFSIAYIISTRGYVFAWAELILVTVHYVDQKRLHC